MFSEMLECGLNLICKLCLLVMEAEPTALMILHPLVLLDNGDMCALRRDMNSSPRQVIHAKADHCITIRGHSVFLTRKLILM